MFEWTIFYRLLNLPDDVATPTYYHLLGLKPHSCTAEAVQKALQERKKRLRQNIPGPQFIPLVLRFETEQLDPAAEVLADPQKRAEYNEQLKEQARQGTADWVKAERNLVIQKARKLVLEHSNDDGTLDEEQRPPLAEKLILLGFSPGDVRVLFEGIPMPAAEPTPSTDREIEFLSNAIKMAISDGGLSDDDESRLMNLADHLGIDPAQARNLIQKQLSQTTAGPAQCNEEKSEIQDDTLQKDLFPALDTSEESQVFVVTQVVDTEEPAPPAVVQIPLSSPPVPPPACPVPPPPQPGKAGTVDSTQDRFAQPKTPPKKPWHQILKILAPLLVSGGFIAFLVINLNNPIVPKARRQTRSDSQTTPSSDTSSAETKETINNTLPPTPTPPPSTTPTSINASFAPSELVNRIQRSFSSTGAKDQLLTDLAVTILACREYAYSFTGSRPASWDRLNRILDAQNHSERAALLTENVQLPVDFSAAKTSHDPPDPEWLKTLTKMLSPDQPKSVQYRAIEELAVDGSAQAADILMNLLESKAKLDEQLIARILRALENMDDPQLPLRLVDLLENPPHRSFVQPILLTLIQLSGRSNDVLNQRNAILPFVHTSDQRKECAQWWREYFTQRHPYITQNQNPLSSGGYYPGPTDPLPQEMIPHDAQLLKLTALVAHVTDTAADTLDQLNWNDKTNLVTGLDDPQTIFAKKNIARQLQDSLNKLTAAHLHLVRSHRCAQNFTRKIDNIEIQKQTNSLLSESNLQRILVHLEINGQLLEILIKEIDENGHSPVILNQIRLQKHSALTDGAVAVRHSAY